MRGVFRTGGVLVLTTVMILCSVWLVDAWGRGSPRPAATAGVEVPGEAPDVSVPGAPVAPAVGQMAADFTAVTTTGEVVTLSQWRGEPVWLVFEATWCTNCRAEAPDVEAAAQALAGKAQVVSVYVGEDLSTVQGFATRLGLTTPQIADSANQIATAYAVMGIPAHFFIDRDGVIRQITVGTMTRQAGMDTVTALL